MMYVNRLMVFSVCTLTILLSVTLIPPSLFVNRKVSAGAAKTKTAADQSIDQVQSRQSSGRIHQLPDTPHTLAAAYYSTQGYERRFGRRYYGMWSHHYTKRPLRSPALDRALQYRRFTQEHRCQPRCRYHSS